MSDTVELPDITDIEQAVRNIIGLNNWTELKNEKSISNKIVILTTFITDSYSLLFEKEETMEEFAYDIALMTSFDDSDYSLTDEVIKAILGINQIVEEEDLINDEIKKDIKVLLIYMLELLQGET